MAYLALYRKYRPLTFADMVGQEFVTTALRNAVAGDRLAHAYLFSGPRGTGKTSTARVFARAINCLAPNTGEPCNQCANCKSILAGQWGLVEIDGASHNRVEDMRALLDGVMHVPMSGKYNVYIIDEVHMLSNAAFNAFLKTLEEPPAHVKFILATTEAFKVPRTIHSRCQHYLFQTVSTAEIATHIEGICQQEGIVIDAVSARLVAEAGNGSLRDALSVLDRVIAYCTGDITGEAVQRLLGLGDIDTVLRLLESVSSADEGAFMTALEETVLRGADLSEVTKSILEFSRVLLFLSAGIDDEALLGLPMAAAQKQSATALATELGRERLYVIVERIAQLQQQLKFDVDKRLGFELGLLQLRHLLHRPASAPQIAEPQQKSATPRADTSPAAGKSPGSASTGTVPASPEPATANTRSSAASAKPPIDASAGSSDFETLASRYEKSGRSPAPPTTPATSNIPPPIKRIVTVGPGQPKIWSTFLEDIRTDHPAWVILLQGLVITETAPHHYRIDKQASHAIAMAWLQDGPQMSSLKAAYHGAIGQPLTFVRSDADPAPPIAVEQATLAGIPTPPDQATEAAGILQQFFPDATIRSEPSGS